MTRIERQSALSVICEAESRVHAWPDADTTALRDEITSWWKADAAGCEAYLSDGARVARALLADLTALPRNC